MPLSRAKTHTRQETDANMLKSAKKNITPMRATSVFVAAFEPVAW